MVLAEEQCCSLLAERAVVLAASTVAAKQAAISADLALPVAELANDSNAAVCAWDATASAVPALDKDKRCQEEATAEQRWADNEHVMALVMPPNPVDAAIQRIRAE